MLQLTRATDETNLANRLERGLLFFVFALSLVSSAILTRHAGAQEAEQPQLRTPDQTGVVFTDAAGEAGRRSVIPGTLRGRFVVEGPPLKRGTIRVDRDPQVVQGKTIYDESLVIAADGGLANVFVYLRDANVPLPVLDNPPAPATVRFKDLAIQPHALAIWTRQPLRVINEDPVTYDLLVQPQVNQPFNVLFPAGYEQEFRLPKSERWPLAMTASIHPWILAHVLVRDNPYFAISGTDGVFEIKDLPPGDWEFQFWHEKTGHLKDESGWPKGRLKVSIGQGIKDLGTIKLTAADLGS